MIVCLKPFILFCVFVLFCFNVILLENFIQCILLTPPTPPTFFFSTGDCTYGLDPIRQALYCPASVQALFLLFIFRHQLTKFPRIALNSLCSPGRCWTCYPPVSVSWVGEITGLTVPFVLAGTREGFEKHSLVDYYRVLAKVTATNNLGVRSQSCPCHAGTRERCQDPANQLKLKQKRGPAHTGHLMEKRPPRGK